MESLKRGLLCSHTQYCIKFKVLFVFVETCDPLVKPGVEVQHLTLEGAVAPLLKRGWLPVSVGVDVERTPGYNKA